MKKLLIAILFLMGFSSCTKDAPQQQTEVTEKLYFQAVVIDNDFNQTSTSDILTVTVKY